MVLYYTNESFKFDDIFDVDNMPIQYNSDTVMLVM